MPKTNAAALPKLMFDTWMLAGEASLVVWLRSCRMMAGGPPAQREGLRMLSEKVEASAGLWSAVMTGGLHQSPEQVGERVLAHYRKPVQANRRRLSLQNAR